MNSPRKSHWNSVHASRDPTSVSWYEPRPRKSLELIEAAGLARDAPIIDVGAGASLLVDELLAAGYRDLTVLDVSGEALKKVAARLGARANQVQLIEQDVTTFTAERRYALWHDRAVFHFLTASDDRRKYLEAMRAALSPGAQIVIATFGPDGPPRCSGLEVVRYSAATLAHELGSDFVLMETYAETHATPAGSLQQFVYCRFRVAA
jgi:trans-aconitate methyltransferase